MTAAGVLGLMAVWRAFYTVYLDFWNSRTFAGAPINRYRDMVYFMDSLRCALPHLSLHAWATSVVLLAALGVLCSPVRVR